MKPHEPETEIKQCQKRRGKMKDDKKTNSTKEEKTIKH
jgi:hypothetical protein